MRSRIILLSITILLQTLKCLTPLASGQGWTWGKNWGGADADAWAIATDSAGNFFAGGIRMATPGFVDYGSGITAPADTGSSQAIWVKYDRNGTPLWAGGTRKGKAMLNSIATDAAGNLIVLGDFLGDSMQVGSYKLMNSSPTPATQAQFFLVKIDPSGNILWAIRDGNIAPGGLAIATTVSILGKGAITTDDTGNIYITSCYSRPTVSIGTSTLSNLGMINTFVAKYTSTGTFVWATSLGGTKMDYGTGITVLSNGHVVICGILKSPSMTVGSYVLTNPSTIEQAFIAELSPAGVPLWGETGGGINGAFATGLTKDKYDRVYMTGGFSDLTITLGGTTITRTYPAAIPNYALFLVQYSPGHNVTWAKTIGSPTKDAWGYCIALASCGQVWVSGTYNEAVSIDGNTLALVTDGSIQADPIFVAGYDLSGGVVGYSGISSGGDDQNGIACDATGNIFICADNYHSGTVIGPDLLPTPNVEAGFVAKYANSVSVGTAHFRHDTTMCTNITSIELFAPVGFTAYSWDNGSKARNRIITEAGKYVVRSERCGDIVVDTIYVHAEVGDPVALGNDTTICRGSTIYLSTLQPSDAVVAWNTGSTDSFIAVSEPGSYSLLVDEKGCKDGDTIRVDVVSPPENFSLGPDTFVCSDVVYPLRSGNAASVWNTGYTGESIVVRQKGIYTATVSNICGTVSDTVVVDIDNCVLGVPNAFTPNRDGKNDFFRVNGASLEHFQHFSLRIFNRFGELVFYTEDIFAGWDGVYKGTPQDLGTYFYLISYDLIGKHYQLKGDLELVR